MSFKGIFLLILLSSIIFIGFVSASDVNDTTENIVTQSSEIELTNINEENNLEISQDTQLSSQENNSRVIYVGQNKTTDGGNGTSQNPFNSFEMACNNLTGEEKVEINVYNGTYYLNSNLRFNTSNLFIKGMGEVIIKNLRNEGGSYASFGLTSSSGNFTFSNLIFDGSNCIYINSVTQDRYFYVFKGNANLGILYNCTFKNFNEAVMFSSQFDRKFIRCNFLDTKNYIASDRWYDGQIIYFEYCIISNGIELGGISLTWGSRLNITYNNVWLGSNKVYEYLYYDAFTSSGASVQVETNLTKYAVFSAHENYVGNNSFEIIGNLTWNDGTTEGIEFLNPMIVEISSKTGKINKTTILENGSCKAIYTSNSQDNEIEIDLDSQYVPIEFKNGIQAVANPINIGDEQIITIIIPQLTNCNINVTINNKTYNVSSNGMTSFNFTVPDELLAGNYQVDVKLVDVNNHLYGMDSTNWTISKINKNMIIITPADVCINDESITLNVLLANDASGNVTVYVGNRNITQECLGKNTEINIQSLLCKGENDVRVVYSGNKKYSSQSKLEKIFVNGVFPDMSITVPENIKMGYEVNVTVHLPQQASGNITVFVGDRNLTRECFGGNAEINIASLLCKGENEVRVIYSGNNMYSAQSRLEKIFVDGVFPDMNITVPEDLEIGDEVNIIIHLLKQSSGNIIISVGDKNLTINNVSKDNTINIENLLIAGYNVVSINYSGDAFWNSQIKKETIYVSKITPIMSVNTTRIIKVGEYAVINVTLPKDALGNLSVEFNSKKQLFNLNELIDIPNLVLGKNTINITYDGDNKYFSQSMEINIFVVKWNISSQDMTLEVTNHTTPIFTVKLPDDTTGNVTISIKDNYYYLLLVNGSASLKVFDLYPGTYNAIISFNGDNKYNAFSENLMFNVPKPVLKANDINMIYTSDTKFSVQVLASGSPVIGKTITLTINGKKLNVITDNNGYANVKIGLPPKSNKYIVIAEYQGVKITNHIKVNRVIQAKNINVKKSAKILKIKVSLKKINNKYLKGKKITLKFKGKKYTAKTNKKGVATFKIKKNILKKLKKGKKYKYQVIYLKDIVSKNVIVKK